MGAEGYRHPKRDYCATKMTMKTQFNSPFEKIRGLTSYFNLQPPIIKEKLGRSPLNHLNQTSQGQKIRLLQADTAISKASNFPIRLHGIDLGALVDQAEDLLGRHDPGGAVREVHGHDAHEHHPEDHLRWRSKQRFLGGWVTPDVVMFVALCEPPGTKVDLATAETKKILYR